MLKQVIFIIVTIIAAGVFFYSVSIVFKNLRFLKKAYPINQHGKRIKQLFNIGFAQKKILRFPLIGFLHALVFWGFLSITFGSFEMILDGIFKTDKILKFFGPLYDFLIATGDIFAFIIFVLIIVFLVRRYFMSIKRFQGVEMTHKAHKDAGFALLLILLLMVSLQAMNMAYVTLVPKDIQIGVYPVSDLLSFMFKGFSKETLNIIVESNWWIHIILIYFFANYLPYSKHFHVFMSLPSVYLSRLTPLTQMTNMPAVTDEVKLMLDPNAAFNENVDDAEIERFGLKDVEDGTWKNYTDSLTCTQCGRCTSVCPANITGKLLSPRKIMIDFRARMNEKSKGIRKQGKKYDDGKSLLTDYISAEEIWACTTCNACAQECPLNIDHPTLILEMRRYIFMEESKAPSLLNSMSTNIENNGAPWQYPPTDRLKWAENLYINE